MEKQKSSKRTYFPTPCFPCPNGQSAPSLPAMHTLPIDLFSAHLDLLPPAETYFRGGKCGAYTRRPLSPFAKRVTPLPRCRILPNGQLAVTDDGRPRHQEEACRVRATSTRI